MLNLAPLGDRLATRVPGQQPRRIVPWHGPWPSPWWSDVRAGLLVLLGAVACVLLIACANVAGLMLARSLARRRELAVRASLGASSWQLARQLMVESLVLAIAGGAAGLVLAAWGVDLLLALAPEKLPRLNEVNLDWRVAAIASLATTLVGLLAGLAPAWQSARPQLNEDLKDGGRTGTAAKTRFRSILVVGEVATALVLLIGAGLMLTSLARLRSVDPGFRTTSLAAVELPLPQSRYDGPAQGRFYRQVLERLQANPATARSAMVFPMPLRGSNASAGVEIEGEPESSRTNRAPAELNMVSPEYFETDGPAAHAGPWLHRLGRRWPAPGGRSSTSVWPRSSGMSIRSAGASTSATGSPSSAWSPMRAGNRSRRRRSRTCTCPTSSSRSRS